MGNGVVAKWGITGWTVHTNMQDFKHVLDLNCKKKKD